MRDLFEHVLVPAGRAELANHVDRIIDARGGIHSTQAAARPRPQSAVRDAHPVEPQTRVASSTDHRLVSASHGLASVIEARSTPPSEPSNEPMMGVAIRRGYEGIYVIATRGYPRDATDAGTFP
ncbi:MAG TPA: hypothetical protein VFD36_26295 [Kofleriaceae bacterium]|nr:hypothetical protein [Kofleriaceae bacterium]